MSSIYTSSSIEDVCSLDRPLVVKCTFDQKKKRITFRSARNCSYEILRQNVEKCFSLAGREYQITWKDDDHDYWIIEEDEGLGEAIAFFGSDEQPVPSSSSLLSGYSSSSSGKKITVHVTIRIGYDGPSLSETSSIASRDEYDLHDNRSSIDLSNISRSELEDDEITVSSKDTTSIAPTRRPVHTETPETIHAVPASLADSDFDFVEEGDTRTESQYLSGPFERLKLEDPNVSLDPNSTILRSERGAAWLRDQTTRTIKSMLGDLPEPSDKSIDIGGSEIDEGELSLQQDQRGKYYYSYNSTASSSVDSGYDETPSVAEGSIAPQKYRPTSMEIAWLESQEQGGSGSSSNNRPQIHHGYGSDPGPPRDFAYSDIPPEVLPFITSSMIPQPEQLTTCSKCEAVLDSIRYVCSTCKEKKARTLEEIEATKMNGKGKDPWVDESVAYPPPRHRSTTNVITRFFNGYPVDEKPIPLLSDGTPDPGYELCPNCLESAGVDHALEMSLAPGSSPSPTSPENALSLWRRTAPKNKGQLRHAYFEKAWGLNGWQDVQQDEFHDPRCSTCNSIIIGKRYKCASCVHFNLCRACYSQVHEIHPSHAFLIIADRPKPNISRSEPGPMTFPKLESSDLPSMKHPDVKCAHCLQDIVGARFHCVVCELVDICSNCESAGLPGNLDSSDGGHNSSHIMMKIPYPLESEKVQAASHQAIVRWNGGDADNVNGRSRPRSRTSSWDGTVRLDSAGLQADLDHGIKCDGCSQPIVEVRYQCGSCPSLPTSYNLCSSCEQRSYVVHDSTHVFFKLPKPVDRPIESVLPILPLLYKHCVGPFNGVYDPQNPKEYLQQLVHPTAYCDLCMDQIRGEWFRCVYCEKDLCEHCEPMDTHDETHFFVVFKADVNIHTFLEYFGQSDDSVPQQFIIPHQVYLS